MNNQNTQEEINEALEREDSIWLNLSNSNKNRAVIDWSDINEINGDYGNLDEIIVVGIPLYGSSDDVLDNATRYVYNQIDIFIKNKENRKLFEAIG